MVGIYGYEASVAGMVKCLMAIMTIVMNPKKITAVKESKTGNPCLMGGARSQPATLLSHMGVS